jgi:hypothetical protein
VGSRPGWVAAWVRFQDGIRAGVGWRPQMALTGSAAGCGSGLVAGWPAACQILTASRITVIPAYRSSGLSI